MRRLVGDLLQRLQSLEDQVTYLGTQLASAEVARSALQAENQELRDELARLKNLPPQPPSKPSGMDKIREQEVRKIGGHAVMQAVIVARMIGDFRPTDVLRFGIAALYNDLDDVGHATYTQARILREVAPLVKPGGHLAYMTCSILDPENGGQVDRFLAENSAFHQVSHHRWTPLDASDGFFLSLMARE